MKDVENVSKQKKCLFIENNIHFWMKIVDKKGEVNFSQWIKMAKCLIGLS
jgi:hypothetical protein